MRYSLDADGLMIVIIVVLMNPYVTYKPLVTNIVRLGIILALVLVP